MLKKLFIFLLFLGCSSLLQIFLSINSLYAEERSLDLGPSKDLFLIDEVIIQGLKKVEKEAILEKIGSKKGLVLDNYLLRSDIKKIYAMKYFESVEAHHEVVNGKNQLIYKVIERPIIGKLTIEGNDELEKDDLVGQMKTKEFAILDINTLKLDIVSLQKFYEEKGYYLASIDFNIKKIDEENVEVIFKIKEYDKVKVKKITFLGNSAFRDEQLKAIMETQEEELFSFMSSTGSFKEFNFQTDIERLKYFYKTKGYLQINIGTPEITVSKDKRWVFISMKITEGPQFSINSISFQGEILFDEATLLEKINLKMGDTYSEENYDKDVRELTEMYQDKGYAFANVLRNLTMVPGENKVNIEFSFEKGKLAKFGKITVKGNDKTRDKVIRRELLIREGAQFSGSDLRKSRENVDRLGFFEANSVVFNTVSPKGKDDVLDVEISVKETSTGQFQVGAGYSTATKFSVNASIAEKNFLGLGQDLVFSVNFASTQRSYRLGLTDPYFLDSKWTLGGEVYRDYSSFDAYDRDVNGLSVRTGYPIFDYTTLLFTYRFEDTKISDVVDSELDKELEDGVASSIGSKIIYDKRNNRRETTDGFYFNVSSEYTGIYWDEKKWLLSGIDTRYYKRLIGDLVFRSRINLNRLFTINGQEIPRSEKLFLGGADSLRGYDYRSVGPFRDEVTVRNGYSARERFYLGGLASALGTLELEHPLAREAGLKWVVFFDAGNVYDKYLGEDGNYDLKCDYGFGFRWFSPIGVLRFEYGKPLWGNGDGQPFFNIGNVF